LIVYEVVSTPGWRLACRKSMRP